MFRCCDSRQGIRIRWQLNMNCIPYVCCFYVPAFIGFYLIQVARATRTDS